MKVGGERNLTLRKDWRTDSAAPNMMMGNCTAASVGEFSDEGKTRLAIASVDITNCLSQIHAPKTLPWSDEEWVAAGGVKNPKTKDWVINDVVRSKLVGSRIRQHFGGVIKKHCPQFPLAKRPRLNLEQEAESSDDDAPNASQLEVGAMVVHEPCEDS